MQPVKVTILGSALLGLGMVSAGSQNAAETPELPPNAKPGECYARVYIPAKYADREERVLIREASKEIETNPAKYEEVEERIVVAEASEKLEVIPAKYELVNEVVIVKEASEKLVTKPAEYATVEEKVLVRPAYTTWKTGRGPIEKVNEATGEIMCLVEVPAEYKTIKKRVIKSPARVEKQVIPAVTKTVQKKVMVQPPTTRKVTIPAKYETVKVQKVISPAREIVKEIPAEYGAVVKRAKVAEGNMQWRPILCEVNMTKDVIARIQRSLRDAGYNPGDIDGILGGATMRAVAEFQKARGLATGQLTMETIRTLGVSMS